MHIPQSVQLPEVSKQIIKNGIDAALKPHNMQPMTKSLHLTTAILTLIGSFHALKINFSAFDITKSLREKVANGEYDIVDVDKDTFGGAPVSVVEHTTVRDIVKELFAEDLVPNYAPKNHYDSGRDLSYVNYVYDSPEPAATSAAIADLGQTGINAAKAFASANMPLIPAAPPQTLDTVAQVLKTPDSDMWYKVEAYIDNKFSVGGRPTLKQIQSRLKGYGVTCEEIRAYLLKASYILRYNGKTSQAVVVS